jgi:perosamine synthetase
MSADNQPHSQPRTLPHQKESGTDWIPYSRQTISESDISAVVQALQGDYLTTGPLVEEFERQFADLVGARFAVAVSNGTAALHLAMIAAGLGAGDRVITSPNTFVASANCAAFIGAIPDFADIDPRTGNLSADSLEESWSKDTKGVIAVDYAGIPADLPGIATVARSRGGVVIEDACHAIGGRFVHQNQSYSTGGHPWADITTYSFHPVKTLTTGEGGMLVTDNPKYATTARLLRGHGLVREKAQFLPGASQDWHYQMQQLGFNYRLTDFQSALGISQLSRLQASIQRRQQIVDRYNQAFADLPGVRPPPPLPAKAQYSWHLYPLQIDFESLPITKADFVRNLTKKGIDTRVMYLPVYWHPWYQQQYGYRAGKCPQAESFFQRVVNLPLHGSLTDGDLDRVIRQVCLSLAVS